MDVEPGSINVVPGAVTLWVDVRGVDKASIARACCSIREQAENVAVCDGVGVQIEMLTADSPVALDKALAAQSEAICTEKGFSFLHMNSGAGHDAMHMTKISLPRQCFLFPVEQASAITRQSTLQLRIYAAALRCPAEVFCVERQIDNSAKNCYNNYRDSRLW